jgi:myo-inositol 2-dehydrogenase / D-chiro-inositol 1-dehydrogenase
MRVGVFGLGRMGVRRAELLRRHAAVEQLIVANRDESRGRELAQALGATWLPIAEALDASLDAAVVATATATHGEIVEHLVGRGTPVLCEKPLAVTVAQSRELAQLIEDSDVPVQMGFQRRHDPGYRDAHDAVASGALGTLYSLRLAAHDADPSPEDYIPTSGGIFRDMHVHDFDLARWLTGEEVVQVFATGSVRHWDRFARHDDLDTTAIVLRTEAGVPVAVTGARHDPLGYDSRAEVFGSQDSLTVGLTPHSPLRAVEGHSPEAPTPAGFLDRFADAFKAETYAFVDVARHQAQNPCTPEDAVQALRIAEACDRSRRELRAVALEEIEG